MFTIRLTGDTKEDIEVLADKFVDMYDDVNELKKDVGTKLVDLFNKSEFNAIIVLKGGLDRAYEKIKARKVYDDMPQDFSELFESIFGFKPE